MAAMQATALGGGHYRIEEDGLTALARVLAALLGSAASPAGPEDGGDSGKEGGE